MKLFLSADMEGTCGVVSWPETERATPMDYAPIQKQMTREVAAACRGALSAGAEEVLVKDAHDSARNIDAAELPECIRILRGWTGDPLSMMSGLDRDDYGAVLFTGYHAWVHPTWRTRCRYACAPTASARIVQSLALLV